MDKKFNEEAALEHIIIGKIYEYFFTMDAEQRKKTEKNIFCVITDEEKELLHKKFYEHEQCRVIGLELGWTERTVQRKIKKIIEKIKKQYKMLYIK